MIETLRRIKSLSKDQFELFLLKVKIVDDGYEKEWSGKITKICLEENSEPLLIPVREELKISKLREALIHCFNHFGVTTAEKCNCVCRCEKCMASKGFLAIEEIERLEEKYPLKAEL